MNKYRVWRRNSQHPGEGWTDWVSPLSLEEFAAWAREQFGELFVRVERVNA